MKFITLAMLIVSPTAWSMAVTPQEVEPMIQEMMNSGKISKEQAEITRKYMQQMKQSDWSDIQKKAQDCIERNPAMAEKISEEGFDAVNMDMCR